MAVWTLRGPRVNPRTGGHADFEVSLVGWRARSNVAALAGHVRWFYVR